MSQPNNGEWYQATDGNWYCWPNPTPYAAPPVAAAGPSVPPPPTAPVPTPSATPPGSSTVAAPQQGWAQPNVGPAAATSGKPLWQKKRVYLPAGLVVMSIIGSAIGGGGSKSPDSTNTASDKGVVMEPSATQSVETAGQRAAAAKAAGQAAAAKAAADKAAAAKAAAAKAAENGPSNEQAFNAAVTMGKNSFDNNDNAIKQGQAQATRNQAVCAAAAGLHVTNWVGKINSIDTNGGGKGVLELQIGPDTKISTWNNAFSDFSDNTLIPQSSSVYGTLADLGEGDRVTFSGTFFHDSESCLEEHSLTQIGKMDTPNFVFRFTTLSKRA